ncbi:MAG: ATP-binding protein [Candidatus Gracilibacteria bacterium]|nr:ATP-binding protein [Candidatus Gracilibacteria bacterium]MDQ7021925.1 ATP-binding protein [Candidatus Gracilibacteria bacterium]
MIERILENKINKSFFEGKIIMILGARQIGKTTLVENILKNNFSNKKIISFNGDYIEDRELLNNNSLKKLELFIEDKDIIFIDEAQKIINIGNTLKILIDKYKGKKQIVLTGSSSINILDLTSEPLTGRKIVYNMFNISVSEFGKTYGIREADENLENFLIFGGYPDVIKQKNISKKINVLKELANSSLYRDILEFQQIKNSDIILKLLKLLALQIGSEVSITELANKLGVDAKTVDRYIDLLMKSYIIFKLPPLFKNKRKELSKQNKIFFYDLGIRNIIINNMSNLENRTDTGALWENFLILERMKLNSYNNKFLSSYFWRNYNKQEVNYIEEIGEQINAYEFKFGKKTPKLPNGFTESFPKNNFKIINKDNYLEFIL